MKDYETKNNKVYVNYNKNNKSNFRIGLRTDNKKLNVKATTDNFIIKYGKNHRFKICKVTGNLVKQLTFS